MARGVKDLQARIAFLERDASASVQSLHHIRTRTSRVLAATSAFTALAAEVSSLQSEVRTLATLTHVQDESVDRRTLERAVARVQSEMRALEQRFSDELALAAESKRPSRPSRPRPWWRFWG